MKLRNLFYLLLALPVIFASCSKEEAAKPSVNFEITSALSYDADVNGGNFILTYTLENATNDAKPTVTCDAEWILNLKVGTNITFKVAPNYDEARSTAIVVSYKTKSYTITVNQAARETILFDAKSFVGIYYAYEYGSTPNYVMYLSDKGFDEDGYAYENGIYYMFDIYSIEPTVDAQGYAKIPAGTYKFDVYDSGNMWSIGNEYSVYFKVNAEGSAIEFEKNFEDITIVVTDSNITVTALVDNVKHVVTYNNAPIFYVE